MKNEGLCPLGTCYLVRETKHVFNIYATFSNRPLYRLERLDNINKISLKYKVSVANAAFDYDMSSYSFINIL